MPAVKQALVTADGVAMLAQLRAAGHVTLQVAGESLTLDHEDLDVRLQAKEGWTAAQGPQVVVVLSTDLTPTLIREGYAQDFKRLIQDRRKELACQYTDRIRVGLDICDELWHAVEENLDYLQQETLAVTIVRGPLSDVEPIECTSRSCPSRSTCTYVEQNSRRYGLMTNSPLPIAVLISGGGTTLRNLLQRAAAGLLQVDIKLVISSTAKAGGLQFAAEADVPARVIRAAAYATTAAFSAAIFQACRDAGVQLVVMAGFLKHVLVPSDFENRVTNIHPGLIPAFCGQGYYGLHVHQSVLEYGAK